MAAFLLEKPQLKQNKATKKILPHIWHTYAKDPFIPEQAGKYLLVVNWGEGGGKNFKLETLQTEKGTKDKNIEAFRKKKKKQTRKHYENYFQTECFLLIKMIIWWQW